MFSKQKFFRTTQRKISLQILIAVLLASSCPLTGWSQEVNTGIVDDSIVGNGNMSVDDTGVGVNGDVNDSSVNNNQNNVETGDNTNVNSTSVNPILYAPSQPTGGRGGSSALILPRNPLPMPNATLGRSNFGLQFGVQNNPGLSAITGSQNALGWFLQGGLTIPFGKIPTALQNPQNSILDNVRERQFEDRRNLFGELAPRGQNVVKTQVEGKIMGLNAYNYAPKAEEKIAMAGASSMPVMAARMNAPQPRVLALTHADIFSQPLNTGQQIGVVETGKEYPYLGHTNSGWVKIMLPTGKEGWSKTRFEYIKNDYTEVDILTDKNTPDTKKTARR